MQAKHVMYSKGQNYFPPWLLFPPVAPFVKYPRRKIFKWTRFKGDNGPSVDPFLFRPRRVLVKFFYATTKGLIDPNASDFFFFFFFTLSPLVKYSITVQRRCKSNANERARGHEERRGRRRGGGGGGGPWRKTTVTARHWPTSWIGDLT